jgi:hypothetical protein
MRLALLVVAATLLVPGRVLAEWQVKPYLGLALGAKTTFLDLEDAVGSRKWVYGGSVLLLGDVIGVEGDLTIVPGFFQTDDPPDSGARVVSSRVTTWTGNVVVALPRGLAQYTLRPYFVGGGGLMRVQSEDRVGVVRVDSTLPTLDLGGGVVGFLSDRVGLGWELRHFRSLGSRDQGIGISNGPEQLSFWRATMSLAVRF